MKRSQIADVLPQVLTSLGGGAKIALICREFWNMYGHNRIRANTDSFYTWQYDIRWAATQLRRRGIIKAAKESPKGVWELE